MCEKRRLDAIREIAFSNADFLLQISCIKAILSASENEIEASLANFHHFRCGREIPEPQVSPLEPATAEETSPKPYPELPICYICSREIDGETMDDHFRQKHPGAELPSSRFPNIFPALDLSYDGPTTPDDDLTDTWLEEGSKTSNPQTYDGPD